MRLPENSDRILNNVFEAINNVEGYITQREVRLLFLLGACPTTNGDVLEIGSFKGRSTIVLAKAAACAGGSKIIAVDPLTSPSVTDPDLRGAASVFGEFQENIRAAGIADVVEFHRKYSHELREGWDRKLRLLWIDGDHTYRGVKADFNMFSGFLSNGAIVAFHDVLANFDGPLRVFMEEVLLSDKFGPAGLWGSTGWAQYLEGVDNNAVYGKYKYKLHSRLSRLMPFAVFGKKMRWFNKLLFKFHRARVPHRETGFDEWLSKVVSPG